MIFIILEIGLSMVDNTSTRHHIFANVLPPSGGGMLMLKLFLAIGLFAGRKTLCPLSSGMTSGSLAAESGVPGSNWAVSNHPGPTSIAVTAATTGWHAGSTGRVATTFPAADICHLFAREQHRRTQAEDFPLDARSNSPLGHPSIVLPWPREFSSYCQPTP